MRLVDRGPHSPLGVEQSLGMIDRIETGGRRGDRETQNVFSTGLPCTLRNPELDISGCIEIKQKQGMLRDLCLADSVVSWQGLSGLLEYPNAQASCKYATTCPIRKDLGFSRRES